MQELPNSLRTEVGLPALLYPLSKEQLDRQVILLIPYDSNRF